MAVVRYREENGHLSRKHGSTLIRTLRERYGLGFAPGCADHAKLSDVLAKLDEGSLTQLIGDHEAGNLEEICLSGQVKGAETEPNLSPSRAEQLGS